MFQQFGPSMQDKFCTLPVMCLAVDDELSDELVDAFFLTDIVAVEDQAGMPYPLQSFMMACTSITLRGATIAEATK